jgi:hypothetical protein
LVDIDQAEVIEVCDGLAVRANEAAEIEAIHDCPSFLELSPPSAFGFLSLIVEVRKNANAFAFKGSKFTLGDMIARAEDGYDAEIQCARAPHEVESGE